MKFFRAIHFMHAEPPYRAEYDRIFQMPLVFRSDCNAVVGDATWLEQLPGAPVQSVHEIVKARAETLRCSRTFCRTRTSASTSSRTSSAWTAIRCSAN